MHRRAGRHQSKVGLAAFAVSRRLGVMTAAGACVDTPRGARFEGWRSPRTGRPDFGGGQPIGRQTREGTTPTAVTPSAWLQPAAPIADSKSRRPRRPTTPEATVELGGGQPEVEVNTSARP